MSGVPGNHAIWEARYADGSAVNRFPFPILIGAAARLVPGERRSAASVLEIGCGAGNNLWALADIGFDVYGTEVAPTAVALASAALARVRPADDTLRVRLSDGLTIPFGDAAFDLVLERHVLCQNPSSSHRQLVAEIRRVLKPGGAYFGVNLSAGDPACGLGRQVGPGDYESDDGAFAGFGLRHFFEVEELRNLFADFTVIDLRLITERPLIGSHGQEEIALTARLPERR